MTRYTMPAILLHWLMALLIIATFLLGLQMTGMPGISPTKLKYFNWHKWMGVGVLLLATLRLLWRLGHAAPAYPASMPAWQQRAAHSLHHLLYLLFFAVPLAGYFYSLAAGYPIVWFGVIPLPVLMEPDPDLKGLFLEAHKVLAWLMMLVVVAHIGAAIKHRIVDKDGIFERMLPFGKDTH
ncbi:cytochrome b [Massilia sp. W12]|uniref:cytochrome b n=1 Tax=Massilia sp. W12 TaxID=3126507 RepID=UPI0030CCA36C